MELRITVLGTRNSAGAEENVPSPSGAIGSGSTDPNPCSTRSPSAVFVGPCGSSWAGSVSLGSTCSSPVAAVMNEDVPLPPRFLVYLKATLSRSDSTASPSDGGKTIENAKFRLEWSLREDFAKYIRTMSDGKKRFRRRKRHSGDKRDEGTQIQTGKKGC